MIPDTDTVLEQIDTVIDSTNFKNIGSGDDVDDSSYIMQSITRLGNTIDSLAPKNSTYKTNAQNILTDFGTNNNYALSLLVGVLKALREDYVAGYLKSFEELVHADIFSDFLDMADYLLTEGFKDPAAVIIGGVIEEHLRKLCEHTAIPTITNNKPNKLIL